jgi:hypothetical protein
MRVFISWAKEPSRTAAHALRDWLPDVIQSLEPWVSSADIGAGARWSAEIAKALSTAKIGIICVSAENQREPWLLFETGALAKTLEDTFVCPYLIQMRPSDLASGPLTQFQAKVADKDGTLGLLSTINRALASDALSADRLLRLFERSWPDLEAKLHALQLSPVPSQRSADEMISEVLDTVRSIARRIPEPVPEPSLEEQARKRRQSLEFMVGYGLRRTHLEFGALQAKDISDRIHCLSDSELETIHRSLRGPKKDLIRVSEIIEKMVGPAPASAKSGTEVESLPTSPGPAVIEEKT